MTSPRLLRASRHSRFSRHRIRSWMCPVAERTRPWTLHILWALSHNGPTCFRGMKKQVDGISARVLTERLRTLEEQALRVPPVREGHSAGNVDTHVIPLSGANAAALATTEMLPQPRELLFHDLPYLSRASGIVAFGQVIGMDGVSTCRQRAGGKLRAAVR